MRDSISNVRDYFERAVMAEIIEALVSRKLFSRGLTRPRIDCPPSLNLIHHALVTKEQGGMLTRDAALRLL